MEDNGKLYNSFIEDISYYVNQFCHSFSLSLFFFFFFTKIMSSAMARKGDKAKVFQKRSSRNCIRKLRNFRDYRFQISNGLSHRRLSVHDNVKVCSLYSC